jgi:hypothetical protein
MNKNIQSVGVGIANFFKKGYFFIFIILIVLFLGLYSYSDSKVVVRDNYESGMYQSGNVVSAVPVQQPIVVNQQPSVKNSPEPAKKQLPGYTAQNVANPSDLLPNDKNSKWGELNPSTINQNDVLMPDLLQAGYHIGIDTIGQTLRNANLQLRSDPIISKMDVGPWHMSTIEPDLARVPLEIGQGDR